MTPILIDTNAYSDYRRGGESALEIVQSAPEIAISVVVLGELTGGFAAGHRESDNRRELLRFLASPRVRVLDVDRTTADLYAQIYRDLRQAGTPIPQNDMWIAATARQHDLALFTYDAHFRGITGLVVGRVFSDFDTNPSTDKPN